MTTLQDKKAILHVLSGLMAKPDLLSNKEYNLTVDDMPEKFHKLVFGAIYNLFHSGVEVITPIEVDTYLSTFPAQYALFNDNQGLDYLYKLEEIGQPENFGYYYQTVKKFTFLRVCLENGIDIKGIYDSSAVDLKDVEEQQRKLDESSLQDMIKYVEEKVVNIREHFSFSSEEGAHMSEGIEEVLDSLYDTPAYGASLSSGYLTTILRGARKKTFMLRSAPTGGGKSRYAIADLCAICIPEIWDLKSEQWMKTGAEEGGLFITTELSKDEVQVPVLCYISGIPEWKILDAILTDEEKIRLRKAVKILKKSNLHIEHLNNFDIDDIKHTIEKNVLKHDVSYVVFDYIHTSIKLMNNITKASRVTIREDQVLLLMSDEIKQLCNKHDIWILSGTQLNNEWKEGDHNLDASSLRGARALGDKLDAGMIMLPVTKKDLDTYKSIKESNRDLAFISEPTHTVTIFKNRRGQYTNVKVWLKIDLGNLRTEDLFVTDINGNLIADVRPRRIVLKSDNPEIISDPLPDSFDEDIALHSGKYDF